MNTCEHCQQNPATVHAMFDDVSVCETCAKELRSTVIPRSLHAHSTKHTPAPWFPWIVGETVSNERAKDEKRLMVVHPDGERLICRLNEGYASPRNGEIPESERKANARLIAAAPELLALASKLAVLPVHSPEWLENPSVRVDLSAAVYAARAAIAKASGED